MPRVIPETTLVDVTVAQIDELGIVGNKGGTPLYVRVEYDVLDDLGTPNYRGVFARGLTPAEITQIKQWLTNQVIPDVNAQEGMS